MDFKVMLAVLSCLLILCGCQAQDVSDTYNSPEVESPSGAGASGGVTVEEQVIVPAHEPPAEEAETPPAEEVYVSTLDRHEDSAHFIKANPGVGQVVTIIPRKVEVIFNYPITTGTTVEVWDEAEKNRFDDGEVTLADEDLLVAITYLDDMTPGVYKVKYHAVFVTEKEGTGDGYFHFELQ